MKPVQAALQPWVEGTNQQTLLPVSICLLLLLHQLHTRVPSLVQLGDNSKVSLKFGVLHSSGKTIVLMSATNPLSTLAYTTYDCPVLFCTHMLLDHVTRSDIKTTCTGSVKYLPY